MSRSLSRPTRGKTQPGRFRLLDPLLVGRLAGIAAPDVVDVGIGSSPRTTLELHVALGRRGRTTGLDLDPARVQALCDLDEPGLHGFVGGFDADLPPVDLVRAANLLRQYKLDAVPDALLAMGRWLRPGGLLVEGTTDRHGDRGVFRVFQRTADGLVPDALVFVSDPARSGFAPRALTPYLPRGMGWHGHPGAEVDTLFTAWKQAFERARDAGARTPAELFAGSAAGLAEIGLATTDPAGHAEGRVVVPAPPGARRGLEVARPE